MSAAVAPDPVIVRAKPIGLWTRAREFVKGPLLELTAADDTWSYADAAEARCGPDGDPTARLARANCLFPNAPVGALIAKIGGSTAGIEDGTVFVVGRYCVFAVPKTGGPLYLTINDEYSGMENNAGCISVVVREMPSPVPPAAAPASCALIACLAQLAACAPRAKAGASTTTESAPAGTP